MRPSDRPVLAEPTDPAPSRGPLRTPLGRVMSLNGALPRGTDARTVVPKRCPCGVLFLAIGKGSALAKFCATCRATQRCSGCNLTGRHSDRCKKDKPRPCRGCGEELGHASQHQYCEACRADPCPECRRFGGRHGPKCRYDRRTRRPALVYHGVVTEAEVLAVYLARAPQAVRIARHICGDLHAEDVVHDVMLWLLEQRDYLRTPPGEAYFLTAVRHTALRRLLYAWARSTVAMDPDDLVLAEQAMARGRSSRTTVRLPAESVA